MQQWDQLFFPDAINQLVDAAYTDTPRYLYYKLLARRTGVVMPYKTLTIKGTTAALFSLVTWPVVTYLIKVGVALIK